MCSSIEKKKHESVNGIERMRKRERERERERERGRNRPTQKEVSILLNVQCNYIVMYLA